MAQPSTSRPARSAMGAGRRSDTAAGRAAGRHGRLRSPLKAAPLTDAELQELRQWLASVAALRPNRARCLLDRAIDHRQLMDEPALHWRAVKARIAGDANWPPMGFRLSLD
jgi:hypothetical protein